MTCTTQNPVWLNLDKLTLSYIALLWDDIIPG